MITRFAPAAALLAVMTAALFSTPASADTHDRRVRITNATPYPIYQLYGSNTGTDVWEEDILGNSVLRSGESVVVDFDDGSGYCRFDLKAVYGRNSADVRNRVNVCTETNVTFR